MSDASTAADLQFPSPAAARAWISGVMAAGTALLLDTETASLHGDVIEVAVLDLQGHVVLEELVRPPGPLDPQASAVHGITAGDLEQAQPFTELAPRLAALLAGRHVIAYNADYDRQVLTREFERAGRPVDPAPRWSCLLQARRKLSPSTSLALHGAHRAAGDCRAALDILRDLATSTQHARKPYELNYGRDDQYA